MSKPSESFLEAADWIGAKLCRDAVWSADRCNWLGDSFEPVNSTWTLVHRAFGPELYNGTSGIAYFLAHLFRRTGERVFRLTTEAALRQSASRLDDVPRVTRGAFYTGLAGVAYAFIKVGELFDDRRLIEWGLKTLKRLAEEEEVAQAGLDVIAGSAGVIPVLLNIHRAHPADFLLDHAVKHGEHLIATAKKTAAGWSWNTLDTPPDQPDLTGFSHGAAGIAAALLELHKATGENKFRVASEQAVHYERRWFSPEHENWPDLRSLGPQSSAAGQPLNYMVAWCHGAPGIGLARLRAFQLTGDAAYRDEAEAALRTTTKNLLAHHSQNNFSLCHGNAGNADLLIYASAVLGNGEHQSAAEQVGWLGIETFKKNRFPWPCGVNGGGETPNLMLGIAGIGYFYLRLYDPTGVPSVLIILPES